MKRELLIKLLNGVPRVTISNESTDEEISATIVALGEKASECDAYKVSFMNERKARIGELLGQAMVDGRITGYERIVWERRLGNEASFVNEVDSLKGLEPKIKTTSVVLGRKNQKAELSNSKERRDTVQDLVDDRIRTSKCDYDAAFAYVQRKHPALFREMDQPIIKT